MGLALIAFAFWLRLGRLNRVWLRAASVRADLARSVAVHAFGWGTLGVLAFSAELVRQHDRGRSYPMAGFHAGLHCLALVPPVALMLAWRATRRARPATSSTGRANMTGWSWCCATAGNGSTGLAISLCVLIMLWSIVDKRMTWSRNLAASFCSSRWSSCCCRRIVFGSAYADMRLAPYLFAIGLVAIRFKEKATSGFQRTLAIAALAFVVLRTGATTYSMWLYDESFDRELAALDHVPRGARMVSFIGRTCVEPWAMSRLLHLSALAIVRNHAFSNDQWTMEGAQLLHIRYRPGWPFTATRPRSSPPALPRRGLADDRRGARPIPARRLRLCLADHAAALRRRAHAGARTGLAQRLERPL